MLVASNGEAECAAVLDLFLVHGWMDSIWCFVDHAVNLLHGYGGLSSGDLLHLLSVCSNVVSTVQLFIIHAEDTAKVPREFLCIVVCKSVVAYESVECCK